MSDERPKLTLRKPGENSGNGDQPTLTKPAGGALTLRPPSPVDLAQTVESTPPPPIDGEAPTVESEIAEKPEKVTEPQRLTPPDLPLKSQKGDAPPLPPEPGAESAPADSGKKGFAALDDKKKRMIMIGGGVVGVIIMGVVAMMFLGGEPAEPAPEEPVVVEELADDGMFDDEEDGDIVFADDSGEVEEEDPNEQDFGLGTEALRINSEERVKLAVNLLNGVDSEFTMEFWCKFVGDVRGGQFYVRSGSDDRFRLSVRTQDDGTREVELYFADIPNKPLLCSAREGDDWLHLAFTVSVGATNVFRLFVDGSHMSTESISEEIALSSEKLILQLDSANEGYALIDDIRVSSKAIYDAHFLPSRKLTGLGTTTTFLQLESTAKDYIADPIRDEQITIEDAIWEDVGEELQKMMKQEKNVRLPYHVLLKVQERNDEWTDEDQSKFLALWDECNRGERRQILKSVRALPKN